MKVGHRTNLSRAILALVVGAALGGLFWTIFTLVLNGEIWRGRPRLDYVALLFATYALVYLAGLGLLGAPIWPIFTRKTCGAWGRRSFWAQA